MNAPGDPRDILPRVVTPGPEPHERSETTERARLRPAADRAAAAADRMCEAGGGFAIDPESALQSCFHDVHVATRRVMVASPTYTRAGPSFLRAPVDTTLS